MNNYTDLARESLENLKENEDYMFNKKEYSPNIVVECYKFLKQSPTTYYEMIFKTISYEHFKQPIDDILRPYLNYQKILIVGLGNINFNADAIGPKIVERIDPIDQRLYLLIPRVKGQTGIESAILVKQMVKQLNIDLVIVIDSLCSLSSEALMSTLQFNTSGLKPGSALSNQNIAINQDYLQCEVLAIGIPCVIKVSSLVEEFFKDIKTYFEHSFNRQGLQFSQEDYERLLGQMATLGYFERLNLINEVLVPSNKNLVVSLKECDKLVDDLANVLGYYFNQLFHH